MKKIKPPSLTKRIYNAKNIAQFSRSLNNQNWDCVFNESTAQGAFTVFQGVIDLHIEMAFPMQTVTMNYKNKHGWMTDSLRLMIRRKNTLSNMSKQQPDNKELHKEYKKFRNMVISKLRNAELTYNSEQLEMTGSDLSKRWKVMRKILGLDNSQLVNAQKFIVNDSVISDKHDIANAFNNFFTSIGPTLASSITSNTNPMSYINIVEPTLYMANVTNNDVRSVIHGLKNSSSGWDGLSAYIGKQCVEGFIAPLTHIINMSITQGVFPDELKLARVIPVYKCNDKQTLSNYRPISILTLFSKVLETVMYKSISKFLDSHSLIPQQTNLRCNNVLATSTFCCDNVNYPRCHNVNLSIPRNVVTTYNITFPID